MINQFLKSIINQLMPNSHSSIEEQISQERLRQARLSFNLALTATAIGLIGFSISLIGGGLLLSGKASAGTIISAVGLVSSMECLKLAKDANDRL